MAIEAAATRTAVATPEVVTVKRALECALRVSTTVLINFRSDQGSPARSRLRGWAENRFILLDDLRAHDAVVSFRYGAPWVLKYVAGGYVCVAQTRFLAHTTVDVGCVYVSYPERIEVYPARKHARVRISRPVLYLPHAPDGTPPEDMLLARLHDLSLGGCAIDVEDPFAPNMPITAAIAPRDNKTLTTFTGRVRHCVPRVKGYTIGVQFDPTTPAQSQLLETIMADGQAQ